MQYSEEEPPNNAVVEELVEDEAHNNAVELEPDNNAGEVQHVTPQTTDGIVNPLRVYSRRKKLRVYTRRRKQIGNSMVSANDSAPSPLKQRKSERIKYPSRILSSTIYEKQRPIKKSRNLPRG
ncbi:hypothetical protein QN277_000546 [Acacia crassicarpa]|uniref:Uncharacterized protein n=1 Tax=Acacia crassicarpa TaxID=499986 RepID=A0AAE1N5A1_9FABA|nr:hypothetical protein QN277_000546 [Acacia crassicarpa]